MGFQEYWQTRKPVLDKALNRALSGLLGGVTLRDAASLMASLEAGKKIRGGLTCMVSEALGGTLDSAVPRAISVEMIQAATLIHDDFVDRDTQRRGRPATWTVEGARRAVLIGDVIFASAIKMMSDLGREDGAAVSHAIAQVSKGALHEPLDPLALAGEIESGRVGGQFYEKIIRLKTGILFGAACRLGAIAAKADGKLRETFYQYGLCIGEAYQIADDLQEVKTHLASRAIYPEQMVALAPALLPFAGAMRLYIPDLLKRKSTELNHPVLELFSTAAEMMEHEIEHRLQSAISEVEGHFPDNGYSELLRSTPRDIIKMFNES
ncbi:MAG TPA: polyprenyl synthetase family protein [Syntrophorhabdales bacterium]|nr:polyprenyl synthetase family protein [Syntrophorhabdales bacterium]